MIDATAVRRAAELSALLEVGTRRAPLVDRVSMSPDVPTGGGEGYPFSVLPTSERAVARLLGRGMSDAEIATRLGLTPAALATRVEQIGLRLLDA
jgi:DNA-binding NarL/FixJ family response regulator